MEGGRKRWECDGKRRRDRVREKNDDDDKKKIDRVNKTRSKTTENGYEAIEGRRKILHAENSKRGTEGKEEEDGNRKKRRKGEMMSDKYRKKRNEMEI